MSVIIPSSEADRKKLMDAMKEISNCYVRIESERELVNEILTELDEKLDIPKKYLRRLARLYHNQNMSEAKAEWEELEALYEVVNK